MSKSNWESEEAYDVSIDLILRRILSDSDGRPYSCFRIERGRRADATISWEDNTLILGGRVGPSLDASGVTHELGHLMCARNEGIGQRSWGMGNPNISLTSFGIDELPSIGHGQIKGESEAWAWQHLIEIMAGLREANSPIDNHEEASFLDDGNNYVSNMSELNSIVTNHIQEYLNRILRKYPDWQAFIRHRIASVGDIIAENKSLRLNDDDYSCEPIKLAVGRRDNILVELLSLPKGWLTISGIVFHHDGEDIRFDKSICFTRSAERAEKFFDIVCKLNELSIERLDNDTSLSDGPPMP
jgi:hypothetical protein